MAKIYNWGIIGLGKIANKFAQDIQLIKNARVHAVASRSLEKAKAFGDTYNANHCYGSYEALMKCPDLDVVYIATPHVFHCEHALLCLNNKIPVLCEKPFAMNLAEVRNMIAAANNNRTFLMEALWTRFLPTTLKVLELIENGAIGTVQTVKADFGFKANFDPKGRLFDQNLGGGSLLDVGIYPVFLSLLVLGKPNKINAIAAIGKTNVDESCGMLMKYSDNKMAILHASVVNKTTTEAFIYGTEGTIRINTRWHEPTSLTLMQNDKEPKDIFFEFDSNGYRYEAEEVQRCLGKRKLSSPLMSHKFSLDLIELLDDIRMISGIHYPKQDQQIMLNQSKSDSNFSLN
jgi:predicted dehydrogenase